MSYADKVQQASSPQHALAALAAGLDEILAKLAAQPAAASDPWGQWDKPDAIVVEPDRKGEALAEQIAAVREALATTADPDDVRALEAKLRLLTDRGQVPHALDEGFRVEADEDGMIELPPVDPERKAARQSWAATIKLGDMLDPVMEVDEAAELYAKGGPMWLYLPYRECIMGMPEAWRVMMVEDVSRDSPAQAQELARDILKDGDANTHEVTIETMANQMARD